MTALASIRCVTCTPIVTNTTTWGRTGGRTRRWTRRRTRMWVRITNILPLSTHCYSVRSHVRKSIFSNSSRSTTVAISIIAILGSKPVNPPALVEHYLCCLHRIQLTFRSIARPDCPIGNIYRQGWILRSYRCHITNVIICTIKSFTTSYGIIINSKYTNVSITVWIGAKSCASIQEFRVFTASSSRHRSRDHPSSIPIFS
mmetsp:Transcript_2753/g.3051  ORF Transcript_2753/g.3051 Transcript_2753/m.3051 type:complete len:201 (-) Transcript_2753:230-832(-)